MGERWIRFERLSDGRPALVMGNSEYVPAMTDMPNLLGDLLDLLPPDVIEAELQRRGRDKTGVIIELIEEGDWIRDCECSECRLAYGAHGMDQSASIEALVALVREVRRG